MEATDRRAEAWSEFRDLWSRFLEDLERPGTVVLVEGERDRASLRTLGVRAPVVLLHHGQSMSRLAHELAGGPRRVIVLTDWDSEGGQLARKVRDLLEADAATVDLEYRKRIARAVRGEVAHVEGLAGWARRSAARTGAGLDLLWDPDAAIRRPTG